MHTHTHMCAALAVLGSVIAGPYTDTTTCSLCIIFVLVMLGLPSSIHDIESL